MVHEKDSCVLHAKHNFFSFFFTRCTRRTRACISTICSCGILAVCSGEPLQLAYTHLRHAGTRFGVILGLSALTRVSVAVSFIQFTFLALLSLV